MGGVMGGVWESLALPEPSPCQHFPAAKGAGESPSAIPSHNVSSWCAA